MLGVHLSAPVCPVAQRGRTAAEAAASEARRELEEYRRAQVGSFVAGSCVLYD
jgi:hypothetical protein